MPCTEYVTTEEVKRVCKELGLSDWSLITDHIVSDEETAMRFLFSMAFLLGSIAISTSDVSGTCLTQTSISIFIHLSKQTFIIVFDNI